MSPFAAKKRRASVKQVRRNRGLSVLSSMAVVEDGQPLATLKMSGNMTLLISKLRMLLTLFVPEAASVFCQFHPSENASQLVLGLEYFVYLQDTLLSPIERLEVIHRALPASLTDPQAAVLIRACKRCALEIANSEGHVEELRKSGDIYCIRRILTPALDQRYAVQDPQVAPQSLRDETESMVQKARAAARKARAEAIAKRAEKQRRQEDEKRKRSVTTAISATNVNSSKKNVDDDEDGDDKSAAAKIGGTTTVGNGVVQNLDSMLSGAIDDVDLDGDPLNNSTSGADDLNGGEDPEIVIARNQRIASRINSFPALTTKFSDICDKEKLMAAAAAARRSNAGGGLGNDDRSLFAHDGGFTSASSSAAPQGYWSAVLASRNGPASGTAFGNDSAAAKLVGALASSGAGGSASGSSSSSSSMAAAAEAAALLLDENRGVSVPLKTPKMSLLDFIHAWLTLDTDCSAVLSEKLVIGTMLQRLGIYTTFNHVRDLIASISGSAVPITTYDIATALILYEELSSIMSLPVFVQSNVLAGNANVVLSGTEQTAEAAAAARGSAEDEQQQERLQQPLHGGRDIRRFLREHQFESRERVTLVLSHLGHPFAIDGRECTSEVEGKRELNILKRQQTAFFDPRAEQQRMQREREKQQQQQQQNRKEPLFLPRQLQLVLRDNRINSWFAPESHAVDLAAMANMSITDFFICASHKTYLGGPQFGAMTVSAEILAHCLLREACRCIEIDAWEGRRFEPIVTHGGMTSASAPLTDVLTVVQRCGFARTQYPLFIILGVHGGVEFQQRLAQIFKEKFGRRILRAAKVQKMLERGKPLTPEALKGKILLLASVSLERSEMADGTRACVPALLRLLAAHRVESHAQWRASTETNTAMMVWNDVEDPSHSVAVQQRQQQQQKQSKQAPAAARRSNARADYSSKNHSASGIKWAAPRRGTEQSVAAAAAKKKREEARQQRAAAVKAGLRSHAGNHSRDDDDDTTSSGSDLEGAGGGDETQDPLYCGAGCDAAERMLHRMSPNTARIDSSNLDPIRYWLSGTNIAALNFQVVNDPSLRCNRDLFLSSNGGTGFIPKPSVLWRRSAKGAAEVFDAASQHQQQQQAAAASSILTPIPNYVPPALPKCELRVEVLCASMLPPPLEAGFNPNSGFSILIQLTLHETVTTSNSFSFTMDGFNDDSNNNSNTNNNNASNTGSHTAASGSTSLQPAAGLSTPPFGISPRQSSQQLQRQRQEERQRRELLSRNGPRTSAPSVITHRYRTALVPDNLHGPSWDDEIWEVDVEHPSAAILTVQALACRHEEDLATPLLVGERSIFVHQLQQGVRMVPLVGQDGLLTDHPFSGVMCRFSLTPDLPRATPPASAPVRTLSPTMVGAVTPQGSSFGSVSAAGAASRAADDVFGPVML